MSRLVAVILAVVSMTVLSFGVYTSVQADTPTLGEILSGAGPGSSVPVTTCAYEDLGWIICPVLTATAKAGDFAFSFMTQSFSQIEVGLIDGSSGAQKAGATIRNIANVLFAMAFLFIVYSLISGRGIGNYNLKRLVPRFIVAVIFVQLSYFICQIMIDLSNIIGVSIQSILVDGVAKQIGPSAMPLPENLGQDSMALASITNGVVSQIDIAWPLLAPLASVVVAAAVICSVLIVVLIIRKVIVVALMMVAPLAFVAYLLPNTSEYFSRWLKMFIYTLMLFPIISLLIGAGQIVSASIIAAGASDYQVQNDGIIIDGKPDQSATLYLVAAGAAVLPLVGTWYAFKAVTSGLEAAGGRLSRSGLQRSSRERDEKIQRREQTTMDMNKKSMMLRGINRLQQLSNVQDEAGGATIFGRSYRGRGKHQQKSPEQLQFEGQVKERLGQIREKAVATGQSPQEVYSQALQRYQDKTADIAAGGSFGGEAGLNINSYEGIDLKASEAYLLESLGRVSAATADQAPLAERTSQKAGVSSSSSSTSQQATASTPDTQSADTTQVPTGFTGVRVSPMVPVDGDAALRAVVAPGAGVAASQVGQLDDAASLTNARDEMAAMANGTGFAARRGAQNTNAEDAKARAAKYMSDSLGGATLEETEELLKSQSQPPLPEQDNTRPNV